MFMRNIVLCAIILCVASLCVGLPFAEAHHGTRDENEELKTAKTNLDNAWKQQNRLDKEYNNAESIVSTLLGQWNANEKAIKDNTWDLANTVAATVISMVLDAVLTDNGETKTDYVQELIETSPTILAAINAAKKGSDLFDGLSARDAYLSALSAAFSALDAIVSANQAAFDFYERV